MKKRALGRGLSALLSDSQENESTAPDAVLWLPLAQIRENPLQPRRIFRDEALAELAASIREYGIVQPVVVTRESEGYRLVVGERRCRAARLAGLQEIPALVKEMAGPKLLEVALIENLQREDLNPVEEAQAFSYLLKEHKLTQEELAEKLGCSRPAVTNALRLLALPPSVRQDLESGMLTAGHARAVLSLNTENQQLRAWEEIKRREFSVRQAEEFVRSLGEEKRDLPPRASLNPDWQQIQEQLGQHLNTLVRILPGVRGKGKIELCYKDQEQLERLVEMLIYSGEGNPWKSESGI